MHFILKEQQQHINKKMSTKLFNLNQKIVYYTSIHCIIFSIQIGKLSTSIYI